MASIEQRGDVWTVRWRNRGESGQHRLRFRSEREALRRKVEIEDAIDRDGKWIPRGTDAPPTLRAVVAQYLAHVARRREPNTAMNISRGLDLFQRFAGEARIDEALTFASLSDYEVWLREPSSSMRNQPRKSSTVVNLVGIVETFWKWAWASQEKGLDPMFVGIRPALGLELQREPAPHKRAPTWEQMDACIEASHGWRRRLHLVLRCTGLRVNQAMRLLWSDVRLDDRILDIRPDLGKSRQERRGRSVPIAPVLAEELAGWGTREGFLIEYPHTNRLMACENEPAVNAWERAKVDPAVWTGHPHHAFRSGFFTGLRRAGVDIDVVRHLVGHSRGAVTERYDDPHSPALVEAVAKVPALCPPRAQLEAPRKILALRGAE